LCSVCFFKTQQQHPVMSFTKVFLLFAALVVVASATQVRVISSHGLMKAPNAGPAECDVCVQFMDQAVNLLLNEILNGGVIATCGDLCGKLNDKALALTCDVVCGYVGIKEFIRILNQTDPDPIWYCQELRTCPMVKGGSVTINSLTITPATGPVGTKFHIAVAFTVNNATSTGVMIIEIDAPGQEPLEDDQLNTGLAPNSYQATFDLDTKDNKNNDWFPGLYNVTYTVCGGDCTTRHPYGGVYATSTSSFTVTQ